MRKFDEDFDMVLARGIILPFHLARAAALFNTHRPRAAQHCPHVAQSDQSRENRNSSGAAASAIVTRRVPLLATAPQKDHS